METYNIDLKRLSAGSYRYSYHFDNSFFEKIGGSDIQGGDLDAEISLEVKSERFLFHFLVNGNVTLECNRCLGAVEFPIDLNEDLVVAFGAKEQELEDGHLIIDEEIGVIDLSWYVYEFVSLALPLSIVHEENACDETMLRLLAEHAPQINIEEEEIDPRWEALKKLKKENN